MDVATLGLAVDSRQIAQARQELGGLVTAAGPAQAALNGVSKSSANASSSLAVTARQAGLAQHELINLSRQVQDVATMAAMGATPMAILSSQGAQFFDIFASSQGSVRGFGAQLLSVVTPARALGAGLLTLSGITVAAVFSWKSYALALDDTAKRMGETTREASKLQAAASFKGIGGDDFAKAMGSFSSDVYQAKNNMGGLAELFRANGVHARGTMEALDKVADLVQRAGSEQQKYVILQQAGLPATAEWVKLLSQGAEGIRKAKAEAAEFGNALNDEMVTKARQFDEAWNKLTTNFGTRWRGAIADAMGWFDRLSDVATAAMMRIPGIGKSVPTNILKDAFAKSGSVVEFGSRFTANSSVADLYGKTGADSQARRTVNTTDPSALRLLITNEQPRLGLLAQLASAAEIARRKPDADQPPSKESTDDRRDHRRAA
jgi:hypothetical protein